MGSRIAGVAAAYGDAVHIMEEDGPGESAGEAYRVFLRTLRELTERYLPDDPVVQAQLFEELAQLFDKGSAARAEEIIRVAAEIAQRKTP